MDIIVTTPKSQMATAAQEAADCIAAGGGEYFRRFAQTQKPDVGKGNRVYYVEDGYVRGFARCCRTGYMHCAIKCSTTGRRWPEGFYVFMNAKTWQWIEPIPMQGFQGFRYADKSLNYRDLRIVGGWRDPKPEVEK